MRYRVAIRVFDGSFHDRAVRRLVDEIAHAVLEMLLQNGRVSLDAICFIRDLDLRGLGIVVEARVAEIIGTVQYDAENEESDRETDASSDNQTDNYD